METLIIILSYVVVFLHTNISANPIELLESATKQGNFDYSLKSSDILHISRLTGGVHNKVVFLDSTSATFLSSIENEVNILKGDLSQSQGTIKTIYLEEGGLWSTLTLVKEIGEHSSSRIFAVFAASVDNKAKDKISGSEIFDPWDFFYFSTKSVEAIPSDSGFAAMADAKGVKEFIAANIKLLGTQTADQKPSGSEVTAAINSVEKPKVFESNQKEPKLLKNLEHLQKELLSGHSEFEGELNSKKFRNQVTTKLLSDTRRQIHLRNSKRYVFDAEAQARFIENPIEFLKTNIISGYEFTRLNMLPENGKEYNFGILKDVEKGGNYFVLLPDGGDVRGVWLGTKEQIQLNSRTGPQFIFTPQLEGCALYSKTTGNSLSVLHHNRPGDLQKTLNQIEDFQKKPFQVNSENFDHESLIKEVDFIKKGKSGYTSFLHPNEYFISDEDFPHFLNLGSPKEQFFVHSNSFMFRDTTGEWQYVVQPLFQKVSLTPPNLLEVIEFEKLGEVWVKHLSDDPVRDKKIDIGKFLIEKALANKNRESVKLTEEQKSTLESKTCILSRRRRRSAKTCVFYTSSNDEFGSPETLSEIEGSQFLELLRSGGEDFDGDFATKLIQLAEHAKINGDGATIESIRSLIKVEKDSSLFENMRFSKDSYELFLNLLASDVGKTDLRDFSIDPMLIKDMLSIEGQSSITEGLRKDFKEFSLPRNANDANKIKANQVKFVQSWKKWQSGISYGMIGKDVLKGILHKDRRALEQLGGQVTLGILANTFETLLTKNVDTYKQIGKNLMGNSIATTGAFIGEAVDIGFTIKSIVDGAASLKDIQQQCSAQKIEENFYKEIFEYRCQQDESQIVGGIVGDSISLGLSAATIGFAATGYGAPVALVLGAVDLAVSLGNQIYNAVSEVAKVNNLIKLTGEEKLALGWKLFWGYDDHANLKQLAKSKQTAHERVEAAVKLLEKQKEFHSMFLSVHHHFDTVVKLEKKRYILYGRDAPDNPPRGNFLCKPGTESTSSSSYSYLCENAVGLTMEEGRREGSALIRLGHRNVTALGFQDSKNFFVIDYVFPGDTQQFTGGPLDDTFVLWRLEQGNSVIEGNGGNDTLILDTRTKQSIYNTFGKAADEVDMRQGNIDNGKLKFSGITQIVGKFEEHEKIILGCDTTFADGSGGRPTGFYLHGNLKLYRDGKMDEIIVPPAEGIHCYKSVRIMLRNNTKLVNEAIHGNFHYGIPALGNISVSIKSKYLKSIKHTFEFLGPFNSINKLTFNTDSRTLLVSDLYGNEFGFETRIYESEMNPSIEFAQGRVQLRINGNNLQAVFFGTTREFRDKGLPNCNNLFIISKNCEEAQIQGGQLDDQFILQGSNTVGIIDGGSNGRNVLQISESLNSDINLCNHNIGRNLSVLNIQVFQGSLSAQDKIVTGNDTTEVDGNGGLNETHMDEITIPNGCEPSGLTVRMRNNTKVFWNATTGSFVYLCSPLNSNNFQFHMKYNKENEETTRNIIRLAETDKEIESLKVESDSLIINDKLVIPLNPFSVRNSFYMDPTVETNNKIRLGLRKLETKGGHKSKRSATIGRTMLTESVIGIVSLGKGNFNKSGSEIMSNLFLCEEGHVNFFGNKEADDEFVLVGQGIVTGLLDGMGGIDTLTLDAKFMESSCLNFDMNLGVVEYYCSKNQSSSHLEQLSLRNVATLIGRPGKNEIVYSGCNLLSCDLKGGSQYAHDSITIDGTDCKYNLNLTLNQFTQVNSLEMRSSGQVLFNIPHQWNYLIDNIGISFSKESNVSYVFKLNDDISTLTSAVLENEQLTIENTYLGKIVIPMKYDDGISEFFASPKIIVDNYEIKVGKFGTVFAFGEATDYELIRSFQLFAKRTNITCYFKFTQPQNRLWIFGTSDTDLMTNDPQMDSILVGNGGDNEYQIIKTSSTVDIMFSHDDKKTLIDLTHFINELPLVTETNLDLELANEKSILKLKNALLYEGAIENSFFIFNGRKMKLRFNETTNQWMFSICEIRVNLNDQKTAVMSTKFLDAGTTIIVNDTRVEQEVSVVKKGDDLVLVTQVNETDTPGEQRISLIVANYYNVSEYSRISKSLTILFTSGAANESKQNFNHNKTVVVKIPATEVVKDFDQEFWTKKQTVYKEVLGITLPSFNSGVFVFSMELKIISGILVVIILVTATVLFVFSIRRMNIRSENIGKVYFTQPLTTSYDSNKTKGIVLIRYETNLIFSDES